MRGVNVLRVLTIGILVLLLGWVLLDEPQRGLTGSPPTPVVTVAPY